LEQLLSLYPSHSRYAKLEEIDDMLFDCIGSLAIPADAFKEQVEEKLSFDQVDWVSETTRGKPILLCLHKLMKEGFGPKTVGTRNNLLYQAIHASRRYNMSYGPDDFVKMNASSQIPLDERELSAALRYHFRIQPKYGFKCGLFISAGLCLYEECRWYRPSMGRYRGPAADH